MSAAGLTLDVIDAPAHRLDVNAQIKLLDGAAAALGDEFLGFHLAQDFDLREIGLLYYVMASSPTLAEALRNAGRYSMLNNEGVRLGIGPNHAAAVTLSYVDVERYSDRHQVEFWVGALVRVCRQITSIRLTPRLIRVRHYRSETPAEILTFLGCSIQFGSSADEIVFGDSAASLASVDADPYLHKLLRGYADEALSKRHPRRQSSLRSRVEEAIVQALPHGRANADLIADRLGMSRRTLARALAAEDATFSELLDELRAALAKQYLSERELPISQIAWLLGYCDASSFTNAFGRWTGSTPRRFRSIHGAPPRQARRARRANGQRTGTK
ncbi:AraC family transcriptional regulator ligand-binding domain-containing protein [Bradyrhizobium diazoefficiens]|nr:AraC family transcriptional regulator ligand-binding domain-containing protein [Bradyrhizobium diazoefficiens]MBR0852286.1 AraC family transcriptional regulator ligand-binding domain-containing protein [Bradyrhizobium diazoefficiens]